MHWLLQVVGLGWPNYWKVMWNKFDCILLVTGIVDMALTLSIGKQCRPEVSRGHIT